MALDATVQRLAGESIPSNTYSFRQTTGSVRCTRPPGRFGLLVETPYRAEEGPKLNRTGGSAYVPISGLSAINLTLQDGDPAWSASRASGWSQVSGRLRCGKEG